MAKLPSEEDIQFYEEHGWWISPALLTADEIERALFGVERYYSGERDAKLLLNAGTDWTEARGNVLRQNDYVSLQIEELRAFVRHPLIAATAARLARTPQIRLFHDQLLYKPPAARPVDTTVGWHTDIAYWKTCSSSDLITAWVPFQKVDELMGPMLVIDGSHKWHGNDKLEFFHETDLERAATYIDAPGSSLKPVPMLLDVGQVSFHHCRTIHGSRSNQGNGPRAALAIHMQDADNYYLAVSDSNGNRRPHLNDFLCRKDRDGNPDYADPDVCPVLWAGASDD